MRGRLTLARALLHRPELLFLDEPTAGLDPVNARLIRQVIREVRDAGATIFLTTHDLVTADERCDRVAFLVEGAIAALDSPRADARRYVISVRTGPRSQSLIVSLARLVRRAISLIVRPSRSRIRRTFACIAMVCTPPSLPGFSR